MRAQPRYIKDYVIPLPPLHEQRRIASRIEWLFAKLDDAEAKLRDVINSSEQRQAAILHSAFSGELTKTWRVVNGLGAGLESWQPTTSDELFEYVTSGSRGWAKYYSDTGAVFLRMGNLDHGTIELDLSDIQHVELPDRAEGQRSLVKKDDILISITADVGMIGFVRNIDYEAYINQHVALARPTQPKSAEFIAWYLVSDMGFVQLRQKQRGVTKVGLGLDDIRSLTLLMPTESEQELILESINSCMDNEARMVEAAEKAIGSIHKTRQSILNQALHGELGTNDPDEPSSKELLASILSGNAGK
jgi:type I restriction enzyme S subunit